MRVRTESGPSGPGRRPHPTPNRTMSEIESDRESANAKTGVRLADGAAGGYCWRYGHEGREHLTLDDGTAAGWERALGAKPTIVFWRSPIEEELE